MPRIPQCKYCYEFRSVVPRYKSTMPRLLHRVAQTVKRVQYRSQSHLDVPYCFSAVYMDKPFAVSLVVRLEKDTQGLREVLECI